MGKKSIKQVIDDIYAVLSPDLMSITDISNKVGSHHYTIKKCVDLISFTQERPKIVVERAKAITLVKLALEMKEP